MLERQNEAILCLINNKCDLVLSGHTHITNFHKYSVSRDTSFNGFTEFKSINILSAGTTGGTHHGRDRSRSFNIIDFSHVNVKSGVRDITVTPFKYDSEEQKWFQSKPCVSSI